MAGANPVSANRLKSRLRVAKPWPSRPTMKTVASVISGWSRCISNSPLLKNGLPRRAPPVSSPQPEFRDLIFRRRAHSSLMFAAFTTLVHFSISARRKASVSAGVIGIGSVSCFAQ